MHRLPLTRPMTSHPKVRRCVLLPLLFVAATPGPGRAADSERFSAARRDACRAAVTPHPRIDLPSELQPVVDALLAGSRTFRDQFRRISACGDVLVRVRVDLARMPASLAARTVISRTKAGLIYAMVHLGPQSDPARWLAHEFEHILEQIDGVAVRRLAARRRAAWASGHDMYETPRAILVERRVGAEMRARGDGCGRCEAEPQPRASDIFVD